VWSGVDGGGLRPHASFGRLDASILYFCDFFQHGSSVDVCDCRTYIYMYIVNITLVNHIEVIQFSFSVNKCLRISYDL